jgi:O-antigen/teichoic acid export membrane protein
MVLHGEAQVLKNGFYNAVGAIIRGGVALLTIPLLIRAIGLEEYGLWTLVSAVVGLVGLAEAGLSVSTTVFLSRDLASDDATDISQTLTVAMVAMLLLATFAALLLWLGADTLVGFFPNLTEASRSVAAKACRIGGLVVWARLLQQVLVAVEQAHQRYGVMNIVNTVQATLSSLGLLVVAWLGGRTVEMMQWQAVTSAGILIAHVVVGFLLLRHLNLRPTWNSRKSLAIGRYSLLTWIGSLGGVLFGQCDRLIVGGLLGTSTLGVYAAITNVTGQINGLSAVPVQPLLPILSNLIAKGGINQPILQQRVRQSFQLNASVALGMGGTLLTLAPFVLRILLPGAIPDEYVLAFRLATIIYTLYSLNAVGYYILFSVNAVKAFMVIQLGSGILSLLMIAAGASVFGLLGASVGNAGYLGTWLFALYGMKKINIAKPVWASWLVFPVTWFFVVVAVSPVIPDKSILEIFALALQSAVLLGWFVTTQRPEFQLLRRIATTRR